MILKKQYCILSFYLTRTLFLAGAFHLLCKIGKNDVILGSTLGMLLGYFILFLFYRHGNVSKSLKVCISIFIVLLSFLSSTLLTNSFLLYTTPTLVLLIPLVLVMICSNRLEITGISRSTEVFHLFTFIIIFVSWFGLLKIVRIGNILPIFQTKMIDMIKCIVIFASVSLLPNLLLLEYKKNYSFLEIGKGYILGCLSIIAILFFILSIYGYEYASILRFPEYMILKRIHFMNYINNIENILVMEWILNAIITLMVCSYVLYTTLSKRIYYSVLVLLCFITRFVFMKYYANILIIKYYFWYICVLVLIISYIKKEKC